MCCVLPLHFTTFSAWRETRNNMVWLDCGDGIGSKYCCYSNSGSALVSNIQSVLNALLYDGTRQRYTHRNTGPFCLAHRPYAALYISPRGVVHFVYQTFILRCENKLWVEIDGFLAGLRHRLAPFVGLAWLWPQLLLIGFYCVLARQEEQAGQRDRRIE